jgi:D-glycero-alpha-D-manno-heptose 1-phosphate guanylyltransferase
MPAGMEAVILAGGAGLRLREVVRDLPKPMAPVGGRPFLGYLIDQLVHWDVRDIVLATGYKSEVVETHFGDGSSHGAKIRYSVEARPMGTGGALRDALRMVRGDHFLLLNGDSFLDADLADLAEFHRGHGGVGTIALVERPDTSRYGRVSLGERGRIVSMREKGVAGPGLINGGVHVWSREISRRIGAGTVSLESDVVPGLLPLGVCGKIVPGYFVDIGIPEDYETACRNCGRLRHCPKG